jgi:hypothetical protein
MKHVYQGATGATYQGQGNNIVKISCTAFVDDVNTRHSGGDTSEELFAGMLQDYNQWQRILEISGGK